MRNLGVIFGLTLAAVSCAAASTVSLPQDQIDRGKQDFMEHCASCHGAGARGDGAVADILAIPVPDLTKLAWEQGGRFPAKYVRWAIDGRADVIAHGPREMPIWGNAFRHDEGLGDLPALKPQEKDVKVRIEDLVTYLKSIQRFDDKT